MAGDRRRTDGPDRRPTADAELSDHPTAPGRRRADRRREGLADPAESGRMPRVDVADRDTPAPVSRRPPVPPAPPRRVAPRTTIAPFSAVPNPEAQPDKYSPERLAETPLPGEPPPGLPLAGSLSASGRVLATPFARSTPADLPPGHPSAPVPDRSSVEQYAGPPTQAGTAPVRAGAREESAPAAPWSTGPTGARAERPRPASAALAAGLRTPVFPGSAGPHPSGPVYGDWTRPSRSNADAPPAEESRPVPPPATTAIPDRDTARTRQGAPRTDGDGRSRAAGDDEDDHGAPGRARSAGALTAARGPATGPGTGPSTQVRGGRAADREVRRVADAERRKELKRQGETMTARAYLDGDDLEPKRSPRRMALTLVAIAVVALAVLGVYSFAGPATQQAASDRSATSSSAAAPSSSGTVTTSLPPLSISPPPPVETQAAPVKAPVTVLNATNVNNLAAHIAGALQGGGWQAPATGAYKGGDVPVTTVYFTEGNETERQAAVALVNQFPQIHGPAPRFFDVPNQPAPGLVVVAAGDWQP